MRGKLSKVVVAGAAALFALGVSGAADAAAIMRVGTVSCGNIYGYTRVYGAQSNAKHGLYLKIGTKDAVFRNVGNAHLDGGRGTYQWAAGSDSLIDGGGACIPQ